MPELILDIAADQQRVWDEAQQRAALDGRTLPELVTAAVGAYLALRRPTYGATAS